MNLISTSEWLPMGDPAQIEREALEMAILHGKEEVITFLAFNMTRLAIEGWVVHRIASILKPGPWEVPPTPVS